MMKPMKLIPPKLIPSRRSSGPEGFSVDPPASPGARIARVRIKVRKGVKRAMVGEEYALPLRECQRSRPGFRVVPQLESRRGSRFARRAGSVLAIAILAAGCDPPDHPGRLPGVLPEPVRTAIEPTDMRVLSPGAGVAFFAFKSDTGPWAVQLVRVDLNRCELGLEVVRAPGEEGMAGGRGRVSQLQGLSRRPVLAAVNGDFFTPEGQPVGTEVIGGVIHRIRDRPAFAWRPGEAPWMGIPSRDGDSVLVVGWRVSRDAPDGVTQVVGGFPRLLSLGRRIGDLQVSALPSFAAARHPRTAVGFDAGLNHLWIIGVDGRQDGYSDGMTLPELTTLLEELGATEAVNLDGGGSTVMTLRGVVVNRPSDAEGERSVVNALLVVRDPLFCGAGE